MPLYEYECTACGHRFELIQKFSDKPLRACPKCKKKGTIKRLFSAPAIQFKGTGWYVTDYAHKSGPSEEKPDGKGNKESSDESAKEKDAVAAAPEKGEKAGKKKPVKEATKSSSKSNKD